jgi:hypothetical protein
MLISRKSAAGFPPLPCSKVGIPRTALSAAIVWMTAGNHMPVADEFGVHDHDHWPAPPSASDSRQLDQHVRAGVLGLAIVKHHTQKIDRQFQDLLSPHRVAATDGPMQITASNRHRTGGTITERTSNYRITDEIPKLVGSVNGRTPRLTWFDGHTGLACGVVGAALSETTPRNAASAA